MEGKIPLGNGIFEFFNSNASKFTIGSSSCKSQMSSNQIELIPPQIVDTIRQEIQNVYTNLTIREQSMVSIVKYLVETAQISGYQLLKKDKLIIFLLLQGQQWRSHDNQAYHYEKKGFWKEHNRIYVSSSDELTAVEGLLISLSEVSDLEWKWSMIDEELRNLLDSENENINLISKYCYKAKISGDYLRKNTKNQVYNAPWTARLAGLIFTVKKCFDTQNGLEELTKLFNLTCSTPMPLNNGLCFEETYVDDNFNPQDSSPMNNCYIYLPYKFKLEEEDMVGKQYKIDQYVSKLQNFIKSFYFNNESLFTLKLAMIHLAIKKVPSGKMLFEIGTGGDGKGMEAILERNLLGEDNCASLDFGIFTDRAECRKSAHFALNKLYMRIQEFNNQKQILSDVWKRIISGEQIDLRENYGFTQKRDFSSSMKIQDLNYENIPTIEKCRSSDNADYCEQIKRRILCSQVGHAKLVHHVNEVDEDNGKFLFIPQDELVQFLSDKITASLYFQLFCLPFFQNYSINQCKSMINNPESIDPRIENETIWLARRLSGHNESYGEHETKSDIIIKAVHAELPKTTSGIKQYQIIKCQSISSERGPNKGKRVDNQHKLPKKIQVFNDAINASSVKLFRFAENQVDYQMLRIDYDKLEKLVQLHGQQEVFGDWSDWGDVFSQRQFQSNQGQQISIIDTENSYKESKYEQKMQLKEIVNMKALKTYADTKTDRRQNMLDNYVQQNLNGDDIVRIDVQYHQKIYNEPEKIHYARLYARSLSIQQLTREARQAATMDHAVDIDMMNAHPQIFLNILKKYKLDEAHDFNMLKKYCLHYKKWRSFVEDYCNVTPKEAKQMITKIFYGGYVSQDIPFIIMLKTQIITGIDLLLQQRQYEHMNNFMSERNNPKHSRLSYILAEEENSILNAVLEELQKSAGSNPLCLMYDGAIVECYNNEQKKIILDCLLKCREQHGIGFQISDWRPEEQMSFRLMERGLAMYNPNESIKKTAVVDGCLYNALENIGIHTQLPNVNGPFTVEQFNNFQQTQDILEKTFLKYQSNLQKQDIIDGQKFICFQKVGNKGHFFSIIITQQTVKLYDDHLNHCIVTDLDDFLMIKQASQNIHIFSTTSVYPSHEEYQYKLQGGSDDALNIYESPLSECSCGGKLMVMKEKKILAEIFGMQGSFMAYHQAKRCIRRQCRKLFWLNYKWQNNKKVSSVQLDQVSVLFITNCTAFTLQFLKYHEDLQFRGYLSTGAIAYAMKNSLVKEFQREETTFMKQYNDARFLRLAMLELQNLGDIIIGDEFSEKSIQQYDQNVHQFDFPPSNPSEVKEMAGDGNVKVLMKVSSDCASSKRVGRPSSKKSNIKPYANGWFLLTEPNSGRILSVEIMRSPENNEVKFNAIRKVINFYPQCNAFIHDVNCKFAPSMQENNYFPQIKYWPIDKWHGKNHSSTCKYSTYNDKILEKRMLNINTSISEQIFSWFRGYARVINEMKTLRHHFIVLYYCKKHNLQLEQGDKRHLNEYNHTFKNNSKVIKRGYACY